ncbi:NAD(P)H-dependent glycerol-3-phosphate dehydrogenase [Agromyces sp. NPDC058110]|uniref:NAD(P)H-dependent glycerol-3-phosphate dehydrogenase n=1 Tax=Agromyces sp. NPDC058110 TaxID=3346345 RepID=UPI0036DEF0C1
MARPAGKQVHGTRVAVLGAGSWGTTFAKILADGGADVVIWARRPELAKEIQEAKRNSDYLPGVNLPLGLRATSRLSEALQGAEHVFVSVPSQSLRENLIAAEPFLPANATIVSLMKGVEKSTGLRMSEVIADVLPIDPARIAVISGPNLALEIAKEQPTAAVVSSSSLETAQAVASVARNRYFRSFVNTDVIGTEFGGVLKNLLAVAIGIVDGVGYGENTKASIITRGLVEMTDFAVAYGAHNETLSGLAGLGDLIATSQSPLSRNNTAGRLLGQGYHLADVVNQMNQTTEGLASVGPVLELARAKGVDMPIVEQVRQVLAGTLAPRDLAPHLTTDDEPQGERTMDGQAQGGSALRRAFKRAFDQLRNGGGSAGGDRP